MLTRLSSTEELALRWSPATFGEAVRAKRNLMGMTQRELAAELHCDIGTVTRWEKGKVDVTAIRFFNFVLDGDLPVEEMWRSRALAAESALKDIRGTLGMYVDRRRQDILADGLHAVEGSSRS